MDGSDDLKWAVRVVVKRQLRDLLQQLHDRGDEIAVLAVNTVDGTCSQFGSPYGEWFMSEQRNLLPNFLKYCQKLNKDDEVEAEFKEVLTNMTLKAPSSKKGAGSPDQGSGDTTGAEKMVKMPPEMPTIKADGTTTPVSRSRRSGRAITEKYLEGMASLKKKSRVSFPANVELIPTDGEEFKDIIETALNETEFEPGEMQVDGTEIENFDEDNQNDAVMDDGDASDDFEDPESPKQKSDVKAEVKRIRRGIKALAGRPASAAESAKYSETIVKRLKERPKYSSAKDKMKVKCDECGQIISGYWNLGTHKKRIHQKLRNAECNVCLKQFWSNHDRETHMASIHTRKCEACGEYVVESAPWPEGIDRRTPREVICSCGSVVSIFSRFGRMRQDPEDPGKPRRRSRAKTSASAKYACGHCGKLFQKRSNCELHSRVHTEARPHVCDICGQQYTQEAGLSYHMVNVHGVVGEVCNVCGKNFASQRNLTTHMTRFHSEEHSIAVKAEQDATVEVLVSQGEAIAVSEGIPTSAEVPAATEGMEMAQIVYMTAEDAEGITEGHLMVEGQALDAGETMTVVEAKPEAEISAVVEQLTKQLAKDGAADKPLPNSWLVTTDKGIIIRVMAEENLVT